MGLVHWGVGTGEVQRGRRVGTNEGQHKRGGVTEARGRGEGLALKRHVPRLMSAM